MSKVERVLLTLVIILVMALAFTSAYLIRERRKQQPVYQLPCVFVNGQEVCQQ
jgi:hypothetical protein